MRACVAAVMLASLAACRASDTRDAAVTPTPAEPARADVATPAIVPPATAQLDAPHGRLVEVDGQRVLHVWGTPRQMGQAHGRLLRAQIVDVLDGYALDVITPAMLDTAATLYGSVADVPGALRAEAEGIVEGMNAAGGAAIPRLGRDLTAADLLVLNTMTDLLAIGCSSVSAWGDATPALAGAAVVVRNLDWSDDPSLLANQLVIAYEPSDPAHQRVLSVAFAGYIGCLSCINEAGVTALFNMGYGDGAAGLAQVAAGFAPANLLLRDALQRRDVDGDGESTADDVEAAVRAATHAGSYLVHVLQPHGDPPARILEVEADGVHARGPESGDPLGAAMLAATNHLRGKDGPQACSRYARIERTATQADRRFDRDGLWALARSLRLLAVVHTMRIEPATRTLALWLRAPDEPPEAAAAPVVHAWDDVFSR